MRYPAIAAAFYNTPHAITPEKLGEIRAFLEGKFALPGSIEDARAGAFNEDRPPPGPTAGPRDGVQMVGRVAVVPVMGVIAQRMNLMSAFSGGTSAEQLGATIDALAADKSVRAIVLNVDSPGGSVFGIAELGDKIHAAKADKKIVAVANATAASAAYWIASQASELVVTTSGQVGSIGVIAAHTDESAADEKNGIKTTIISAGKYKAEGYLPLTDDARAAMQANVDKMYGMFVRAVARGRGVTENRVDSDFGQGRMLLAKDAVAAGMADRVATLEQTLRRLGADGEATQGARADDGGRFRREVQARMAELGLPTAKL